MSFSVVKVALIAVAAAILLTAGVLATVGADRIASNGIAEIR